MCTVLTRVTQTSYFVRESNKLPKFWTYESGGIGERKQAIVANEQFPDGFVWGVSTSSFQIEGSYDADGRGESIWDRFASVPGNIEDGTNGKVACDHYKRWSSDVDIIQDVGVKAYRFSIAWPRLFPTGKGSMNPEGMAFYDRLVDRLLAKGILPFTTLYHWDLPQALQDEGGWQNRDTTHRFAEYAYEVGRRLGDRVKHWMTHNEPWCISVLGNEAGAHAPGIRDRSTALAVAHHVLLSHGMAVGALREAANDIEVGIVHMCSPGYAASSSEADTEATRVFDEDFNRWFVEPTMLGRYPQRAVERYRSQGLIDEAHPVLANPSDLEIIAAPTDFLGLNYYSRAIIRADIPESQNAPREIFAPQESEKTDMGWEVFPEGFHQLLVRASTEWKAKKIYVTECGVAYSDGPDARGVIDDRRRIDYLDSHFRSARSAIADGAPLAGIFVWSLMDNFEWAHGYTKRFGLVWVDYETQERTLKNSARWYREVIRSNGLS